MQIVKLRQDYYHTSAYVCAEILTGGSSFTVYAGEMAFKMQPDITIKPLPPLQPFYRNWKKGDPVPPLGGASDQRASLETAIVSFIKRIHRTRLAVDSEIVLDVEILSVREQEEFDMPGLHVDFQNAVIRFYLERS